MVAGVNRHDSQLLRPTLQKLGRFEHRFGIGVPEAVMMHPDAVYESAKTRALMEELGCRVKINQKGFPLQAGAS